MEAQLLDYVNSFFLLDFFSFWFLLPSFLFLCDVSVTTVCVTSREEEEGRKKAGHGESWIPLTPALHFFFL